MTDQATIDPATTMEAILEAYPSAQRALFQRYHVGGCSACGFQPTDTLAQVCKDHNILDVNEVIGHILRSHEVDQRMQIEAAELRASLAEGSPVRLVDVRMPQERDADPFAEAEPLDYTNQAAYMELPKDTRLVFACQTGTRSLDVAAYFAGHGFTNVRSLRGGVDGWRKGA